MFKNILYNLKMSIKVKTRKILWSKSGNRCAFCKQEIVKKIATPDSNFILGEECHIISSKKDGPRGNSIILKDYDIYENLILLCANDHKLVDEFPETFTVDVLKVIKDNHESWIYEAIQKDLEELNKSANNVEYLDKIETRVQLDNILSKSHFHFFDFSSITDEDLVIELGSFFDDLNDYSDIESDIGISNKTQYLIEYEKQIKTFQNKGIYLFGEGLIREYKFINVPKSEYKISMFVAVDKNLNANLIVNDKLIVKLPDDFTPRF